MTELKLVDLEINKGINDEYVMALHGSVVELHVVEQINRTGTTGLNIISRKRSWLVMLAMSDYVVSGMHDELRTLGYKHTWCWLSICIIIMKESIGSLCWSCY